MRLRNYQSDCIDKIFGDLAERRSTLAVLPTGTGKTIVFAQAIKGYLENTRRRALVIAHREELIFQAADKIEQVTGNRPAIEMADLDANNGGWATDSNIVVASVQSLNSGKKCKACICFLCNGAGVDMFDHACEACDGSGRQECTECSDGRRFRMLKFSPEQFSLVVVDEAHHATAKTYKRILNHFTQNPECKVLGVTATPDRADEEALGQIFESVAYNYEIPDAIKDGWLVDIEQQYVIVESLDFSSVRTTAGDLNADDLQRVMMDEKPLHGVVNPTIELAGDRPTLIFTPTVAYADKVAEIINRHKPDQAVCIHGKTPSEIRREHLQRFKQGQFQFLVNCGIFLEGFDETRIACVAIARPTKSRALYAQMIGRGTRPIPGIVDNDWLDADGRRESIACSGKPALLVLDFVGNSGQHKLVTTADILGGNVSDEVVDHARASAIAKGKKGERVSMAQQIAESQNQIEEEAKRRRKAIVSKSRFSAQKVNPFDVFDLMPKREPGWHKGRLPSEKQLEVLKKNGIETEGVSFWQAQQFIGKIFERREKNLCTYKQAKLLSKFGYDTEVSFDAARGIIDALAANKWKRPA